MHFKKGLPFIKEGLPSLGLNFWGSAIGVIVGGLVGILVGIQPRLVLLLPVFGSIIWVFFARFEQVVIALFILRSALDTFSAQQIPALFGLGFQGLTILYVAVRLMTKQSVKTDRFWWFFIGWCVLQGLWVVLLPIGGLGFDEKYLSTSFREWIRLLLWPFAYLLIMQLKDRFQPKTVITVLLLALVMPLIVAAAQIILPASLIPGSLYSDPNRIRATFGHANVFATFLLLFIGITWWKLNHSQQRRPWFILLSLLVIFLVSTRAIFCLMMLAIIVLILTAQKANLPKVIGGIILFGLVIGLFASTEFGQERLSSIGNTPVLNPNIDIWRAILMSNSDENSFNWRLSQWYLVLQAWKQYPLLGYGLGLSSQSINSQLLPHNDYIRAMAEGGIVGLICYLSLFGIQLARLAVLFKSAPRGSAQQDFCLFLIAVIVAFMVGMITENIWSHTVFFMYFSVMQAIAGWDWLTPQTSQSSDVSRLSLEAKLIS